MSSPLDKKFGDMFIHGVHPDGRCDLVWSSHGGEFTLELVGYESAEQMILAWNRLKDEAERLREYEWMYEQLQK